MPGQVAQVDPLLLRSQHSGGGDSSTNCTSNMSHIRSSASPNKVASAASGAENTSNGCISNSLLDHSEQFQQDVVGEYQVPCNGRRFTNVAPSNNYRGAINVNLCRSSANANNQTMQENLNLMQHVANFDQPRLESKFSHEPNLSRHSGKWDRQKELLNGDPSLMNGLAPN